MTTPPGRGTLLAFFGLAFASYAYFDQGGGPNQFTRLGLTVSLVERGRVDIDPYQEWTFDKALKDGHYYCDKAPGLSLLAVPAYALSRPLLQSVTEPGSRVWINLALYLVTLLAVSLPVALGVTAFYRQAWIEAGPRSALWVSLALALGSPVAVYASLFYAHALCAALAWLAFGLLTTGPEATAGRASGFNPEARRVTAAGLLAGWATLSEYPVALITAALFVYLCLRKPRDWRAPVCFVLGGLPAFGVLIAYNLAAFGEPLVSGYRYEMLEEFRESMGRGVMGITGPSVGSVLGMFFFPYRGLLWFWPFFLCLPVAVVVLVETRLLRGRVLLAAVIVGLYLLFGCSYYLWTGGASFGPRHVIPCLPFAAYLVARAASPLLRVLVPVTTILSIGLALLAVSTLAEFPEVERGADYPERLNPLFQIAVPRFVHGQMSVKVIGREGVIEWTSSPLTPDDPRFYDAVNVGELLGLRGLASLFPLALLDGGLGVYLWLKGHAAQRVGQMASLPVREAG
jgi:hypothetical protein